MNQNNYLRPPSDGQLIQLIGHSRGAAVNARLSQLLESQGYTVDQYVSLDGYSTDWPFPSNLLGDISIVGTATAERMVNYEVQQGLLQALVLDPADSWLESIFGQPLTSDDTNALLDAATNWRAPGRPGFDNITITGPSPEGDPLSNHLNIVCIYSDLNNPYLKDDFEELTNDTSGSPSSAVSTATSAAMMEAGSANSGADYRNFQDGSFESLGTLLSDVKAANIDPGDSVVLAYWLKMVEDPAQLLAAEWTVSGDARLVQSGGNALAELTQSAGTTSIGQYLELDSEASSVAFDLSVLSAKPGDQLQVLFGNKVLDTFDLSSPSASGHESVSLAGYASQKSEVTFQLVGPAGDTAQVELGNLAVMEATHASAVSGAGTYGGTATLTATLTTGGTPLAGKMITFTLSHGGTTTSVSSTTNLSGVAALSGVTLAGLNAGTSFGTITASFVGDATDLGSSASGDLIIDPAPLTVWADNKVRQAGQLNPPLTASYFGFVNGDGPSSLTSPADLETR